MLSKGFPYETISVDRVDSDHICKPYQYLKTTIYDKRLEIYDSQTLIDELIDLERNINTGKVDHPDGGRKDVSDAVCGALFNASKHAEEFAYDYGESIETTLDISKSVTSPEMQKQQIKVQFEEELQNLLNPLNKYKEKEEQKEKIQLEKSEAERLQNKVEVKKDTNTDAFKPINFGFGSAQAYKPTARDGIIF